MRRSSQHSESSEQSKLQSLPKAHIESLVSHIEDNIAAGLHTGTLLKAGFTSRAQLYRDFYSATGHSVREYINKRRLSNALALVKLSDMPLDDIAYQCGYSSLQVFYRAIKAALGVTPLEYKNSDNYFFFPPYNGLALHGVTVSAVTVPRTLCVNYYHAALHGIENRALNALYKLAPGYSGRIFGRNGGQIGSEFCYELYLTGAEQLSGALSSGGFFISGEKAELTAQFATTVAKNNEDGINAAWDYLYSGWLQRSMFEYTGADYFEEYLLIHGKRGKLKLYLPIRRRLSETLITLEPNPQLSFIVSNAKGLDAERTAAQTVIGFMSESYPHIMRIADSFYMHKSPDACACGILAGTELYIPTGQRVTHLSTEAEYYLVLHSNVMGEYERYCDMLVDFARQNGLAVDISDIFAVYDIHDNYENPKIKLYCPVKIETK